MKNLQIIKFSSLSALLICMGLIILAFISDFDGDIGSFTSYIARNALETLSYLGTVWLGCFAWLAFLLWGFWRTSYAKKGCSLLIVLFAAAGCYVFVYFDFLYFDYLVPENQYEGYFVRDAIQDANNSLDLQVKYPEYYRDTIGSSNIQIDKYRAWLRGNKSNIQRNYNMCLKDGEIIFTAVSDFSDKGNYCEPKTRVTDNPVELIFKPMGQNKFECIGCDEYLLPVYWIHISQG
ncbi:hypothetical protein [Photobacterium nomapromontoriensis]|uniref:hypothetical protein n=1 Tax=Photobacterium nomapromontoriensis TaxID=2910237 RepID=UPI003D122D51